jgi:transposase
VDTIPVTARADLTDAQWAVLEPLLPKGRKPGRPLKWSKRQLIEGSVAGQGGLVVAGRAPAVRALAGDLRPVSPLAAQRHLGADPDWVAGPRGRSRIDHLGCQRGLHHRLGAPARGRNAQKGDLQTEPPGEVGGVEPADHALGRSRGGWSTKLHLGCEQGRKPLSILITAGRCGDSPQFAAVLQRIRVPRLDAGRPRTRPDRVLGDKAYSAKGNRSCLRRRRIRCVIPVKEDQAANRRKLGSRGGRPPAFDKQAYKQRHAVACGVNLLKTTPRRGHPLRQAGRAL